jgi:hydrogenase maturation protease
MTDQRPPVAAPTSGAARRILVAGVGNVFLGDDGFGVEVVRRLAGRPLPAGVDLVDVGIRGVHLAYDLLDGCDLLVLVDAAARGAAPGTVTVLEVGDDDLAEGPAVIDPHDLGPDAVLAVVRRLGGRPGRTVVVACEPADVQVGMGLSAPVERAVPEAVRLVETILEGGDDAGKVDQAGAGRGGGGTGRPGVAGHQAVRADGADVRT